MTAPVHAVNTFSPKSVDEASLNGTGKTDLTLSAVPEVGPVCSEGLAIRPPSADAQTYVDERDPLDDELLRELLPTILTQYAPETETELRAAWGDR